jgi:hypothetical protein
MTADLGVRTAARKQCFWTPTQGKTTLKIGMPNDTHCLIER